ncbi:Bowman-Birk type trypsin inhibitor [Rhynchospora pubera]|uniref:Bowman-Birk type trypsin inhibitor n=1 Tax=Rhynchospora pubera TaxID=906938 RepID=A0AAV8CKF3_9POAL|nr:Bowman-Birk type trypsin inhibitor [Rhynchospora pubera]
MGRIATLSLVFFFIMLSLPLPSHSQLNSEEEKKDWSCCDTCNICTRSIPPYCVCDDLLPSCPPDCEQCVEVEPDTAVSADTLLYQCLDFLFDPCQNPCTTNASSILSQ